MRNAGKIMTVVAMAAFVTALGACTPSREQPSDQPPGVEQMPSIVPAASPSESPAAEAGATGHAEEGAEECTAEDIKVTGGQVPQVTIPHDCPPPTTLLTGDLTDGSGAAAVDGSTVELNYKVVAWSDGQVKENTFGQDRTITVTLGQQNDFKGWDEALDGLHEAARRVLVFPPNLGYTQGPLAQETLVVVAQAVSVTSE